MDKLWLIIKREYLTRVKKRSFILATILTPLAFALFMIVVGFIFSYESDEARIIAVIDEGEILKKNIDDGKNLYFKFASEDLETLKAEYDASEYDGILVIPKMRSLNLTNHTIYYYSENQMSIDVISAVESRVKDRIRKYKIEAFGMNEKDLESLETNIELDPQPIKDTTEDVSSMASFIAAGIGGAMGVIMYMTVFIYGMMVMRSVMEEKTSRIVEVMVSSVKPFQLMLGKIIGVGGVGLTQVAIWAILIPLISIIVNLVFGFDASNMDMASSAASEIDMEDTEAMVGVIWEELKSQNWFAIGPLFIFYFLGGYFLYASMFAAVGSAMGDDLGEGQALTIPITIPVVIAFYIMIVVIRTPQSTLAVWSSIFPLFSPIVMPARLTFNPPVWQIVVSMLVLAASSIFFVWVSARIYRVGILMYGKKVSFKELGKWLFYSD